MTPQFQTWAKGYGNIIHQENTQAKVQALLAVLSQKGMSETTTLALFTAADRITNAAMWLVVHQAYAKRIDLTGAPLPTEDFKSSPQGHVGGSLNMVPAYVGYMLANALSGKTDSWIMGQGHCVAAIDSVNLILNNMRPEHAARYSLTEQGLTRFCTDFYSYRLNEQGQQDSPLGSHVNIHTAGGCLEGGYLGFAELQYMHMPLPDENLVAFLSDGAFEEQRGSDWGAHWWRAEDTGIVVPIMIFNGRRIDQRSMISQEHGLPAFIQHLKNCDFDPIVFDGTDPAAFACMILESEYLLQQRAESLLAKKGAYPALLPYGVAVAKKGAGFYGAGTNAAHNLPLGGNPSTDRVAREHFNQSAQQLFVPFTELQNAIHLFLNHDQTQRPLERDHIIAARQVNLEHYPTLPYLTTKADPTNLPSPMAAIDDTFMAYINAHTTIRPRVGNPDEILSNHLRNTLYKLKHRVTEAEMIETEAIDGKIITALNEEAVVCACLANKAGINLVATYEAFGTKMLGALRQEIIWSDHLLADHREPGWISLPVILTSHTYENGKNERSHQDPTLCEALLNEPSDVCRVLFPADYNSAVAALDHCYHTHGRIFPMVVCKTDLPIIFDSKQSVQLLHDGITVINAPKESKIILTAIGSYQLQQVLLAAQHLEERGIPATVNYMIEPGRFRASRGPREAAFQVSEELREQYFPRAIAARIFVSHTRPEVMSGVLRPLDTGKQTKFLGFINQGGTLDTEGMLFVNRQSWEHIVDASAGLLHLSLRAER